MYNCKDVVSQLIVHSAFLVYVGRQAGTATLVWKMTSRMRCGLEQMLFSRRRKHPYRAAAAGGPLRSQLAHSIAEEPRCMREAVANLIFNEYGTAGEILGVKCQSTIHVAVSSAGIHTGPVECFHAKGRRRMFNRCHTHTMHFEDLASDLLVGPLGFLK